MPSGAEAIRDAFDAYQNAFRAITRHAPWRFVERDWRGGQADAVERLDLYREVVDLALKWVHTYLADHVEHRPRWSRLKAAYSQLISGRGDRELAETFFNSITRRVFSSAGVDRSTEFVDSDFEAPPPTGREPLLMTFLPHGTPTDLILEILRAFTFRAAYADLGADAAAAGQRLERALALHGGLGAVEAVEVATAVLYRGKGAYLAGRIRLRNTNRVSLPLILCLLHEARRRRPGRDPHRRGLGVDRLRIHPLLLPRGGGPPVHARPLPQVDHAAEAASPSCTTRSAATSTGRPSSTARAPAATRRRPTSRSRSPRGSAAW